MIGGTHAFWNENYKSKIGLLWNAPYSRKRSNRSPQNFKLKSKKAKILYPNKWRLLPLFIATRHSGGLWHKTGLKRGAQARTPRPLSCPVPATNFALASKFHRHSSSLWCHDRGAAAELEYLGSGIPLLCIWALSQYKSTICEIIIVVNNPKLKITTSAWQKI